jgi:CheY-like chemotaxis protein
MTKARVMVIEDDTDLREAICLMLHYEGHEASGCSNGREAIHRLEDGHQSDVILLDLMMPVMDGERFLRIRKAAPRLTAIPVVVVSALQRMRVDPEELNVDEIISKPVDPAHVIETVRRYATG